MAHQQFQHMKGKVGDPLSKLASRTSHICDKPFLAIISFHSCKLSPGFFHDGSFPCYQGALELLLALGWLLAWGK